MQKYLNCPVFLLIGPIDTEHFPHVILPFIEHIQNIDTFIIRIVKHIVFLNMDDPVINVNTK